VASWLIVSLAGVSILALLALTLVVLPPLLIPGGRFGPPAPQPIPSSSPAQRSPVATPPTYADVTNALSAARGNVVAALGVLAVLIGALVGFLNFRESQRQNLRTLDLSRRGQVNERFSKALEQLSQSGDDKVDVRIGAIYSLEQIARDSPEDLHGPVMLILTAFLRGHSNREEKKTDATGVLPIGSAEMDTGRLRADFQVIATDSLQVRESGGKTPWGQQRSCSVPDTE
jgi:hypothetical protein